MSGTGQEPVDGGTAPSLTQLRTSLAWSRLWDLYVVVGCAMSILVIFVVSTRFPGDPLGASIAVAAIAVWTKAFGRENLHAREFGTRSYVFAFGLVALFGLAVYQAPSSLAVSPVLYALMFMSLPIRSALVATAAVNVMPSLIVWTLQGPYSEYLPMVVAITLVALVASPVIGTSMTQAVQLSEHQSELLAELAESRAEAARLSHDAGIAAERSRLAGEIHDTLAQGFTSIVTLAQAVESEIAHDPARAHQHVELIRTTARENLAEARAMVEELTPSALAGGSLVESIRRQGSRLTEASGIGVSIDAADEVPKLATSAEVVLLRAAQEAFTNVRRHSEASTVTVSLTQIDGVVRLSLRDNGIGFSGDDVDEGFGLRGMRHRAAQVGGRMSVTSAEGDGTTVVVEVPS